MTTKYILILLLNSTSPDPQYQVQAWSRPFDTYEDCLRGASEIAASDALLKDCKSMDVPGSAPDRETVKPPG